MSKVSLHPICIKNQDENNNILGLDTSELRFGSVQNLYLELETLPLTELFRSVDLMDFLPHVNKCVIKFNMKTCVHLCSPAEIVASTSLFEKL